MQDAMLDKAGSGGGDAKDEDCSRSVWFSGFRKRAFQVYRGVLGFEVSGLGFSGFGV